LRPPDVAINMASRLSRANVIADPPAPQNPVYTQVRIRPESFARDVKDSDYFVPPFCPVFISGRASTSPYAKHYATKKSMREGIVPDAVCNFYDKNYEYRFRHGDIRFLGVSHDGIADMKGAKQHPDSTGRFSVIVSGAVTMAVNPNDLMNPKIGDGLHWYAVDNGFNYSTYTEDFSPAVISNLNYRTYRAIIAKKGFVNTYGGYIGTLIGINAKKTEVRVLLEPACSAFEYETEKTSKSEDAGSKSGEAGSKPRRKEKTDASTGDKRGQKPGDSEPKSKRQRTSGNVEEYEASYE